MKHSSFFPSLAFLALGILSIFACSDGGSNSDDSDVVQSSSSEATLPDGSSSSETLGATTLTIQNESSSDIDSVKWRGVNFGKIAKNAFVTKNVEAGQGFVSFYRITNPISARSQNLVAVEQNEKVSFVIQNNTVIEEINVDNISNSGTFASLLPARIPKSVVPAITSILATTAVFNSSVIDGGNPQFTSRGFCWSKEMGDLNYSCDTVSLTGAFQKNIANLDESSKYFVRSYLDNGKHYIAYSYTISFTTTSNAPSVGIGAATNISYISATLNAVVSKAGNPAYIEKGFCYGTGKTPAKGEVNYTCESIAGESANYQLSISELTDGVKYYVRAYIENGQHPIQYSDTVSFTTINGVPEVSIEEAGDILGKSARLNATIVKSGYPTYTERGFCYSKTVAEPSKTNGTCVAVDGETISFSLPLTGLSDATKYYARAYISNEKHAVQYSEAIDFSTVLIDSRDGKVYQTAIFDTYTWMIEDLRYGAGMYNWSTANTVCPTGWHLPNNATWTVLKNALGTTAGTYFPSSAYWWSATENYSYYAYYWYLSSGSLTNLNKTNSYAVRCVKD